MLPDKIEGTLFKWTNYWNGWQPRWFILNKSVLSYYNSQDQVTLGCKGYVNIASAIVTAHKSDPCRLDVVVPGEQHFHLRACTPHERQSWLVALGSVKSAVNSEKALKVLGDTDKIRQKKCEVRLYCDLLMQQVHTLKELVNDKSIVPDSLKLDECSCLLSETCDAFIHALEDCVKLTTPNSPLDITGITQHCHTSTSKTKSPTKHKPDYDVTLQSTSCTTLMKDEHKSFTDLHNGSGKEEQKPTKIRNFFSILQPNFTNTSSIVYGNGKSIDTILFLECSSELLKLFDLLNSSAFAPIKLDFESYIKKIHQKFDSSKSPTSKSCLENICATLQNILCDEAQKGTNSLVDSASISLLWLKRSLEFACEFLKLFLESLLLTADKNDNDVIKHVLSDMVNRAYHKTLKEHHSFVMRGIFTLAAKETVQYDNFYASLFLDVEEKSYNGKIRREELICDLKNFLRGLSIVLEALNELFVKCKVI